MTAKKRKGIPPSTKKGSEKLKKKARTEGLGSGLNTLISSLKSRWKNRNPYLKYFLGFVFGILVFYALYSSSFYVNNIEPPFVNGQAQISSAILNLFGENTRVTESAINSSRFGVDVKAGCDGMETIAIFICAILFTPFMFRLKWPGMLAGLVILLILNIFRIVGLYYAGIYWTDAFDARHLHGGFVVFLFIALIIWFIWANWATKKDLQLQNPVA